ncbi:MAG: PP2C family protein-serine/threonine phosphatase [Vulcanimicrobiaceae bacterium]
MKRLRSRVLQEVQRGRGTLTATAILFFALAIAVTGALATRQQIKDSFQRETQIQQGQLTLEETLKLQLDEENYIAKFVITHDPAYLDAYQASKLEFESKVRLLQSELDREHLQEAQGALADYELAHRDWHQEVAQPLLRHPELHPREIDKRGKILLDEETKDALAIEALLDRRSRAVGRQTQEQINQSLYVRLFWLVAFGLLAILFNVYRSRLNRELDEERMTTQTLQRAFRSEHVPLPRCKVGSAYGAASSHLAVGGDVFDVYQLSDRTALLLIADVSGKGVDAAVLTAFIKFTIRGIALRRSDPGFILQEFNTAFPRTVNDPYMFVSMFVGMLDTQTLRLEYASAGHDVAYVRRAQDGVRQLAVTGPVLGVMEEKFETKTLNLGDGDMIVLATDGLTEARDARGALLEADGAMRLIERGSWDPQLLADGLVAQVRVRSGDALRDDLAVLVIRVIEPPADGGDA